MNADTESMRGAARPPGGGNLRDRIREAGGDAWPPRLRAAVDGALALGFPAIVLWEGRPWAVAGAPSPAAVPNEAAWRLLGGEAPVGRPLHETWPAAWDLLAPMAGALRDPAAPPLCHDAGLVPPGGGPPLRLSLGPLTEDGRVAGFLLGLLPAAADPSLLHAVPHLVWRAGPRGECLWASPQWGAYTGQSEAQSRGFGWLEALHPEDREGALAAWHRAGADTPLESEIRLRRAGEGSYRWFQVRALPLPRAAGEAAAWLGTATDVDRLRQAERRQRLLLTEFQHRVRNTLSVIRSIIRRTVQASRTVEDLAMHLDGRVSAFARVQATIGRDPMAGLDLAQIVADELLAHAAREDKQVAMTGPPVLLRPKAGESLALAIHELTTNAVKFGALSVPEGVIRVEWAIEPGPDGEARLRLGWTERGGPPVSPPTRHGFGREMLQRGLPYDLRAEARLDFDPAGLRCTLLLPCAEWLLPADRPRRSR